MDVVEFLLSSGSLGHMVLWYVEHAGRVFWPLSSEGAMHDFARQLVIELM